VDDEARLATFALRRRAQPDQLPTFGGSPLHEAGAISEIARHRPMRTYWHGTGPTERSGRSAKPVTRAEALIYAMHQSLGTAQMDP
jgi:hypothetical protein